MKQDFMEYCKDCKYWLMQPQYRLRKSCWCCRTDKFTGPNYYCRNSKKRIVK